MKLGDRVTRRPETFGGERPLYTSFPKMPLTGTVVYIHPEGRFHVVAFPVPHGKTVREAFLGVE